MSTDPMTPNPTAPLSAEKEATLRAEMAATLARLEEMPEGAAFASLREDCIDGARDFQSLFVALDTERQQREAAERENLILRTTLAGFQRAIRTIVQADAEGQGWEEGIKTLRQCAAKPLDEHEKEAERLLGVERELAELKAAFVLTWGFDSAAAHQSVGDLLSAAKDYPKRWSQEAIEAAQLLCKVAAEAALDSPTEPGLGEVQG